VSEMCDMIFLGPDFSDVVLLFLDNILKSKVELLSFLFDSLEVGEDLLVLRDEIGVSLSESLILLTDLSVRRVDVFLVNFDSSDGLVKVLSFSCHILIVSLELVSLSGSSLQFFLHKLVLLCEHLKIVD